MQWERNVKDSERLLSESLSPEQMEKMRVHFREAFTVAVLTERDRLQADYKAFVETLTWLRRRGWRT